LRLQNQVWTSFPKICSNFHNVHFILYVPLLG
jgi:hypothetical protein